MKKYMTDILNYYVLMGIIIIILAISCGALLVDRANDRRCLRTIALMMKHKVDGETIPVQDKLFAQEYIERMNR